MTDQNTENPENADGRPLLPEDVPGMAEILAHARSLPWDQIDLECPVFASTSGCDLVEATATVNCECGQAFQLNINGQGRARCPACKEPFRHVLIIQGENFTPSAVAEAMAVIIQAQAETEKPDGV